MTQTAKPSISIVVVSNPLSVSLANHLLFEQTTADIKVLVIDYGQKKSAFIEEIRLLIQKKPWDLVIDLSTEVSDSNDSKPSFRKRLTRKYKSLPLIKPIYSMLQKKYLKKIVLGIESRLKNELDSYLALEDVSLFLLTETYANQALLHLFPKAKQNYYEHGISDYVNAAKMPAVKDVSFYGLFASEFKNYSPSLPIHYLDIELRTKNDLKAVASSLDKNNVVIILQNLEIYTIGVEFWETYFNDILKRETDFSVFYIKPHPLQSNEIIQFIHDFFRANGREYFVMPFAKSIELEFEELSATTKSAYSPYSSSIFYLSKIHASENISFYESLNRIKTKIGNAPTQYKQLFNENYRLVKAVFGSNCTEF